MPRFFNNNINENVNFSNPSHLNNLISGPISCSAWVNVFEARSVTSKIICGKSISSQVDWAFYITNSFVFLRHSTDDSDGIWSSGYGGKVDHIWLYATVNYNGSQIANSPTFYTNGILYKTFLSTLPTALPMDDSADSFYIGVAKDAAFPGIIAHVTLHNRILSVGEIIQNMNFPGSVKNGLVGYYPLFGYSNPEYDYSGKRAVGKVTGTAFVTRYPPISGLVLPKGFSRHAYVVPAAAAAPLVSGKKIPTRNLLGVGL